MPASSDDDAQRAAGPDARRPDRTSRWPAAPIRPLVREPLDPARPVHGASGLDGADLPEPGVARRGRESADRADGRRCVRGGRPCRSPSSRPGRSRTSPSSCAPSPALSDRIGAISLMGGSLGVGNTTASAEFNIWQDPEAAAIVFAIRAADPDGRARRRPTRRSSCPTTSPGSTALGTRTGPGRRRPDAVLRASFHRERYGWDGPADPRRRRRRRPRRAVADRAADDADRRRARRRADARPDDRRRAAGSSGKAPNAEVLVRARSRRRSSTCVVEAIATFP